MENINNKKYSNSRIISLLEFLFSFFTIICSNSVYLNTKTMILWSLLGFFLIIIYFNNNYSINKRMLFILTFIYLVYVSAFILISIYISQLNILMNIFVFLIPLLLFFVIYCSFNNGFSRIILYIKNILLIMAFISLLFWIIAEIGFPTNMSILSQWGGTHYIPGYWGMHYVAQGKNLFFGLELVRNTGIFVEAPMYSFALSVGLILNVFIFNKKLTSISTMLLILTILTTTSTTGLLLVLLTIIFYFYINFKKVPRYFKIITIPFVIFIAYKLIGIILDDKQNVTGVVSVSLRSDDFNAGNLAWHQHLLFGNGVGNMNPIIMNMSQYRIFSNQTGFSSGIMEILAFGGIYLLIMYMLPIILSMFSNKKLFIASLLVFMLFVFTIVDVNPLFYAIEVYFVVYYLKNKKSMENSNE